MASRPAKRQRTASDAGDVLSSADSNTATAYAPSGNPPPAGHAPPAVLAPSTSYASSSNRQSPFYGHPGLLPPINFDGPPDDGYAPPSSRPPNYGPPPDIAPQPGYPAHIYGPPTTREGYGMLPPIRAGPPGYAAAIQQYSSVPQQYALAPQPGMPVQYAPPVQYVHPTQPGPPVPYAPTIQYGQPLQYAPPAQLPPAGHYSAAPESAYPTQPPPEKAPAYGKPTANPEKQSAPLLYAIQQLSTQSLQTLLHSAALAHQDISKSVYDDYELIAKVRRDVIESFDSEIREVKQLLYTDFAHRHEDPNYKPVKHIKRAMEGIASRVYRESPLQTKKSAAICLARIGKSMLKAVEDPVGEDIVESFFGDETFVSCIKQLLHVLTEEDIRELRRNDSVMAEYEDISILNKEVELFDDLDEAVWLLTGIGSDVDEDEDEDEDDEEKDEDDDEDDEEQY